MNILRGETLMKYEIAYISGSGNTEKLAHGIADSLPSRDTFVTDLSSEEITRKADVYLIGFGMKKNVIPFKIMDVLEELEDKTILFFVTASVIPSEEHIKEIERRLNPFMPSKCDYRGLYLCTGKVSNEKLDILNNILAQDPNNQQAKAALEACQQTLGHPNQEDIDKACDFISKKLKITDA